MNRRTFLTASAAFLTAGPGTGQPWPAIQTRPRQSGACGREDGIHRFLHRLVRDLPKPATHDRGPQIGEPGVRGQH